MWDTTEGHWWSGKNGLGSAAGDGEDAGAATVVVDLAGALERVMLGVVWRWAMQVDFPQNS